MERLTLQRARSLRENQTHTERLLWNTLRNHQLAGWKWKRQVPKGPYIVDFYCASAALVVELDGPHHEEPEQVAYDARRTRYLNALGLRVVRFDSNLVLSDPEGLCQRLLRLCSLC